MPNDTNVNTGNAGEYFVAGELERRGFTVAVPMPNVKDFDLLAINRTSFEQFAIQVKTTGYKQKKWTLNQKNENLIGEHVVYVFVSLNELDTPEYHIVPSKIVAETIKREHAAWLKAPGKDGQPHKDTNIRNFFDKDDVYLDAWKYLDYSVLKTVMDARPYAMLLDYIPKLQNIEFAKIYPEKQTGDGSAERPFIWPHYDYADVVDSFVRDVYMLERTHPEYELNNYGSILEKNGIKWDYEEMKNADVTNLDEQAVLALVMGAIRAERFCDGALKEFLEDGCIVKWLKRLQEIK